MIVGLSVHVDPVVKSVDPVKMAPYLTLQAWWSKTAADIETKTTSEATIAELETRYGITLPADFREYLSHGAPVCENWDAEDGNWWPFDRIKNIPDEYEHPVSESIAKSAAKHLIFIDYSIWSWAWGISCANDETYGKVALIGGVPDGYVADSFNEFVQRYATNWMSVSQVPRAANPIGRFQTWLRDR